MPDVQEVFRMTTQHVKPDPGALDRQHGRQRRRGVGRKVGAFAVAAAVVLVALMLVWALRPGERATPADGGTDDGSSVGPTAGETAAALSAARGFFAAFSAFDADGAMRFVADDASLSGVIDGQVAPDTAGLTQMLAWLEAWGYRQSITSCEAPSSTGSVGDGGYDITVVCTFAFTMMPDLERGPFPGSTFAFTIRDGEIVVASLDWNIDEFSPRIWEPFRDWVRANHAEDFDEMYLGDGGNYRLTDASIRLWHRNAIAYVKAVQDGTAA